MSDGGADFSAVLLHSKREEQLDSEKSGEWAWKRTQDEQVGSGAGVGGG